MRRKIPTEDLLYTVLLGILMFFLGIAILLIIGSNSYRASALKAAFVLGLLVNALAAVHRFSKQREGGYLFLAAAAVCLYFLFR